MKIKRHKNYLFILLYFYLWDIYVFKMIVYVKN